GLRVFLRPLAGDRRQEAVLPRNELVPVDPPLVGVVDLRPDGFVVVVPARERLQGIPRANFDGLATSGRRLFFLLLEHVEQTHSQPPAVAVFGAIIPPLDYSPRTISNACRPSGAATVPPCWPPSTIPVTTSFGSSAVPSPANQALSSGFWFSAEPVF